MLSDPVTRGIDIRAQNRHDRVILPDVLHDPRGIELLLGIMPFPRGYFQSGLDIRPEHRLIPFDKELYGSAGFINTFGFIRGRRPVVKRDHDAAAGYPVVEMAGIGPDRDR